MSARSVIGRSAYVRHNQTGAYYWATVIDAVAGKNIAKRVRIQKSRELAGRVLMPGEYQIMEFMD